MTFSGQGGAGGPGFPGSPAPSGGVEYSLAVISNALNVIAGRMQELDRSTLKDFFEIATESLPRIADAMEAEVIGLAMMQGAEIRTKEPEPFNEDIDRWLDEGGHLSDQNNI